MWLLKEANGFSNRRNESTGNNAVFHSCCLVLLLDNDIITACNPWVSGIQKYVILSFRIESIILNDMVKKILEKRNKEKMFFFSYWGASLWGDTRSPKAWSIILLVVFSVHEGNWHKPKQKFTNLKFAVVSVYLLS